MTTPTIPSETNGQTGDAAGEGTDNGTGGGWREALKHGPQRRGERRRGRRGRGVPIAVNLAPMIDVSFLLLIFFLVTTSFERAEGIFASELPKETGQPTVALPISPIVVRVMQTGSGHDDYVVSLDRFDNALANFDELTDALRQIQQQPGFDKQTPVVVVAGNDVRWDHVVGCWNAALRAECARVAFAEP